MHDGFERNAPVDVITIDNRGEKPQEPRIGAQDLAGRVDGCDGHGRRIEEAREPHFCCAQRG